MRHFANLTNQINIVFSAMQKSTCAAKTLLIEGLAKNIVPGWQKYRVRFLGAPNLYEGPTNLPRLDALGRARETHVRGVRLATLPRRVSRCRRHPRRWVGLHLRELVNVCAWLRFAACPMRSCVLSHCYAVTRRLAERTGERRTFTRRFSGPHELFRDAIPHRGAPAVDRRLG